ncbi:MAG TPA: BatA domain-containing protein [Planctomycetota bacterium]|nr:BatA domain-containing protein [Planctomycetota bacterium]
MTFDAPWALLGLLLLALLILLDRLRRRPREVVWPSLQLWRAVAEAPSAPRRRIDLLLLLECAAVALLSLGAAEPALATRGESSIYVVRDVGAHMHARRADGRTALEATDAEIARMGKARVRDASGALLEAAASMPSADLRVLATNREGVEGEGYVVVGRAADGDNTGIDAIDVKAGRIWFAVATDGGPREVTVNGARVETGKGYEIPFAGTLSIAEPDNLAADNTFALRPLSVGVRDETGSKLVRAALSVGTPTREGDDLVIRAARGGETVRGADCVATDIFEGLFLDECVWDGVATREGEGILTWRGRAVAAWLDEKTLWLGMPVDGEWDDNATLALLVEKAKRKRAEALLGPLEVIAGEAVVSPKPGLVWTKGVDRPWDGRLPEPQGRTRGRTALRAALALAAAAVLALYVRAIVRGT